MPSSRHELLVELFRNRGELACELLKEVGIVFDYERVVLSSTEIPQIASPAYRADAVVELQESDGQVVAAVIVEVQLGTDSDKKYSWPHYVAALRSRLRCQVVLLVVAPDPALVAWARTPIPLGHPGFCLTPLVLGFDELPRITDPELARGLPELAVLSALAYPELEVATVAVSAISPLPESQSQLYLDIVMTALPPLVRQALEARMEGYEYQSEFARRYINKGREEGLQRAVLSLARAKLDAVTTEDEAAIQATHDEHLLEMLIRVIGSASSPEAARSGFDRTISRHAALSSPTRSAES